MKKGVEAAITVQREKPERKEPKYLTFLRQGTYEVGKGRGAKKEPLACPVTSLKGGARERGLRVTAESLLGEKR